MVLIEDNEPEATSGYVQLAIHVILKALEDYFCDDEDDKSEQYRESARAFFSGSPLVSTYPLLLSYLGWDVAEHGLISAERWQEIIEQGYSSIADAKPKMGLSTRLIPTGSDLWVSVRNGRSRRI